MKNRTFYRKRNKKPVVIGEILKKVIGDLETSKNTDIELINNILKKSAPKKLMSHMRAQRKSKEKLVIYVDSPIWLYEAHKHKEELLRIIQQGQIKSKIEELLFRVGRIK
ncbi:MAG: hypothetical protein U9Q63_04065 [Patescibacteria group bacterium]|nr:hypothetical protein [Patescibacteria group bacterium]